VDGVRVAYRAYGDHHGGVPLVLLHRFRATMDDWDPALIEALAAERMVVAFDSIGVGESGGATPPTLEEAADTAALVVRTLGIGRAISWAGPWAA
jgi:pimeloyl-ACP methyl ester carboxylesterase